MSMVKDAAGELSLLRVALPGVIATAGSHGFLSYWLAPLVSSRFAMDTLLLLSFEILVFGFVLNVSSKVIVMMYEGFHLPFLTNWLHEWQKSRVKKLHRRLYELTLKEAAGEDQGLRIWSLTSCVIIRCLSAMMAAASG